MGKISILVDAGADAHGRRGKELAGRHERGGGICAIVPGVQGIETVGRGICRKVDEERHGQRAG